MTKNSKSNRYGDSGKFIIGASGFARVSAVEGIVASKRLLEHLRRLENELPDKRRAVLAAIYGARK